MRVTYASGYYHWDDDCTEFISHALWDGGVRDPRDDPELTGISDYPIPYWNRDKTRGETPLGDHPTLSFTSWMRAGVMYDFLTVILRSQVEIYPYSGPIPHYEGLVETQLDNRRWLTFIQHARPGDLVFYWNDNIGDWGHVAMVVGWGDQTFYGDDWGNPGNPSDWRSALDCGGFSSKPHVVERNGVINYSITGSRAIDNTGTLQTRISIVHVK